MCGRITQYRYPIEYAEVLSQMPNGGLAPGPLGQYNVPPQSMAQLMHQDEDGLRVEAVKWGYAHSSRMPPSMSGTCRP